MSALARYFKRSGHEVGGYDRTESPLTKELEAEGIAIHYEDRPDMMPDGIDVVVYTPAVPTDTAEFKALAASGVEMKKRSQVLGELTRGKKCIAVAGTHGKTTTSAMIAHLLNKSDIGCSAFLGGISKNINSNLLMNSSSEYVVVEADEYDRSFLQLHPFYSVITATDPDHLDIYGTHEKLIEAFEQYANQTDPEGAIFVKEGLTGHHHGHSHEDHDENHDHREGHGHDEEEERHLHIDKKIKCHTYSAHSIEPDYYAINVRNYHGSIFFDLRTPERVLYDLELTAATLYNVENAVAAAAVALHCGLNEYQLRAGLKSFEGIRRRFDIRVKNNDIVYIDDYAHHPQEIAATIESVRYLYPNKRVVGIFQPHLYSRTRDLADQFAAVLDTLDETILLPIYPAREKPIPGVASGMILRKMRTMNKYLCSKEQLPDLIDALYPDVLLTMGAGDIDRLVPQIEKQLTEN